MIEIPLEDEFEAIREYHNNQARIVRTEIRYKLKRLLKELENEDKRIRDENAILWEKDGHLK